MSSFRSFLTEKNRIRYTVTRTSARHCANKKKILGRSMSNG